MIYRHTILKIMPFLCRRPQQIQPMAIVNLQMVQPASVHWLRHWQHDWVSGEWHRWGNPKKKKPWNKLHCVFGVQTGTSSGSAELWLTAVVRVQVGGILVANQVFGLSKTEAPFMSYMAADGILGLAFQSIASDDVVPVFNNMIEQDLVSLPLFSVYLSRWGHRTEPCQLRTYACVWYLKCAHDLYISFSNDEQSSEVVFGGANSSHYVGQITWIPLSSPTYWQITMDRYERHCLTNGECPATFGFMVCCVSMW